MSDKVTYPKIARKIWWLLRNRLKQSMPTTISSTLVASVSEMTDASARANVLSPLREMGLIDENGKPSDLMERWRHDDEYKKVCLGIRDEIYPTELIEAFSEARSDQKVAIKNWFMKNAKVGDAAAKMYADTFLLLSEANFDGANDVKASVPKANKPVATSSVSKSKSTHTSKKAKPEPIAKPHEGLSTEHGTNARFPSVHIDVQVHISPETSLEQIDKIFESMSKHLNGFVGG